MKFKKVLSGILLLLITGTQVSAAEIRVAVASNFLLPLKEIIKVYQQDTGEVVAISAGSTGKLYAQIINGAPFDVFLAANSREPQRLEKSGAAVEGSRFTYARGKLALWEPKALHAQQSPEEVLQSADIKRLAIANPLTAPYGAAAMSVITKYGLEKTYQAKILRGENVSQAYQYIATGAADMGFVALSQIKTLDKNARGNYWVIDASQHEPIQQQAVLLSISKHISSAEKFLQYLKSPKTRDMIETFGYGLE